MRPPPSPSPTQSVPILSRRSSPNPAKCENFFDIEIGNWQREWEVWEPNGNEKNNNEKKKKKSNIRNKPKLTSATVHWMCVVHVSSIRIYIEWIFLLVAAAHSAAQYLITPLGVFCVAFSSHSAFVIMVSFAAFFAAFRSFGYNDERCERIQSRIQHRDHFDDRGEPI